MKIVVFGAGKYYENRKKLLEALNIIAFIDNNEYIQGTHIDGIRVYSPNELDKIKFDYILLMSKQKNDMRTQLYDMGVPDRLLLEEENIGKVYYGKEEIYFYNNKEKVVYPGENKIIPMFSHSLSNTGAPIVFWYAGLTLLKFGYSPIMIASEDGALRKEIVDSGIAVVIDECIDTTNIAIMSVLAKSQAIILNTVLWEAFLYNLEMKDKPIYWWLHEADCFYRKNLEIEAKQLHSNVHIYAVSNIAKNAFIKNRGVKKVEQLAYGIPDIRDKYAGYEHDTVIFACIGTIDKRKGQDIFTKAIRLLPDVKRSNAEFWIIGYNCDNDVYEEIKNASNEIKKIKILNECSRQQMYDIYSRIDVVVCPSREDPLPVVITEGMLLNKVCVVSNRTGTAEYITDRKNGLICEAENPESLKEKMEWILDNKDKIETIGINARQLYENNFSIDIFEKNILKIIKDFNNNEKSRGT